MPESMEPESIEDEPEEESPATDFASFTNDSAMMIAYERFLEGERADRLFFDPFAKLLQGDKGEKLSNEFTKHGAAFGFGEWDEFHKQWTAVRTRFIDDEISQAALGESSPPIRQLVNLGAGWDTRPYRLPCLKDFTLCCAVDMAEVQEPKKKVFERLKLLPTRSSQEQEGTGSSEPFCTKAANFISVDLLSTKQSLKQSLEEEGFVSGDPAVFVAEGLVMYLGGGVDKFFDDLSRLAAPGSVLICNFMDNAHGCTPEAKLRDELLTGWTDLRVANYGDETLNYGRYPTEMEKNPNFSFVVCRKE